MSVPCPEVMQHAWKKYVEEKTLDLQVVRSEVARSWQRCRSLNVDPHKALKLEIKGDELRERLAKKNALVEIADPYMQNIFNFVRGSGFQVVLADEGGFLLKVVGDREIVRKTKLVQLCPGGNWSEAVRGTNAIGTAMAEGKPIQIHAWEHFCNQNHFLTCSAAPIFDSLGQIIGILDVSGDYRYANFHTLGMVVAAVKAIENELALRESNRRISRYYRLFEAVKDSMSDGLLSVDHNGIIVDLNSAGGDILGVQPHNALGKHIGQVFLKRNPIGSLLDSNMNIKMHFNGKASKKFTSTASLLHDESGSAVGVVAVLKPCREKEETPMKFLSTRYSFESIVGESDSLREAKNLAAIAARSPSTVLLVGESGTGKELFAQAIHNGSSRKSGPFFSINCAAIPETLIESELFGYEEGAFTGAKKSGQAGKFEIADGGTVFLDEIGDMPLFAQVKLLRVIQERKVARVGSAVEIPVDIRIIAATHKNLAEEVEKGNFRKDLYYRLNVLNIKIPALRDRLDDIPLLSEFILKRIIKNLGKENISLHKGFYEKCQAYDWPGNIRELENMIEHALNMVDDGDEITADILPFTLMAPSHQENVPEIRCLKDIEKDIIETALKKYKGNIIRASTKLGVSRNTIYRKIKEYEIEYRPGYGSE